MSVVGPIVYNSKERDGKDVSWLARLICDWLCDVCLYYGFHW